MKLSHVKALLPSLEVLQFRLEDGTQVPKHFHITEVGSVVKNFIDCGGTIREERYVNFQLWSAGDIDHRLEPAKLLSIIALSEKHLALQDAEIEVEYQSNTIGKYGLAFDGNSFLLQNKTTACLATDACGIPAEKLKRNLSELTTNACCAVSSEDVKSSCGCDAEVLAGSVNTNTKTCC